MKLISISDFVLLYNGIVKSDNEESRTLKNTSFDSIVKYAEFLKQPLTLGMFVPCDLEGNILQNPGLLPSYELEQYRKAKEKVLFKGFEFGKYGFKDQYFVKLKDNNDSIYPFPNVRNYTIEDLVKLEIELTKSAIKQIGL